MSYTKHGRTAGASEFSWGEGLTPRGFEDAPPSLGGVYRGMAPPVDMSPAVTADAARLHRRQAAFDEQRAADMVVAQAAARAARAAEARRVASGGAS